MKLTLSRECMSPKQERMFDCLAKCGELVLAIGPKGVRANLVGEFAVRKHTDHNAKADLILDCSDGTNHIHIDWQRVRRVALSEHHGEGKLTFLDGTEELFELYCMSGPYPQEVCDLIGDLF